MPGDSMELIIEVDSAVIVKEGSSFNLILDGKKLDMVILYLNYDNKNFFH